MIRSGSSHRSVRFVGYSVSITLLGLYGFFRWVLLDAGLRTGGPSIMAWAVIVGLLPLVSPI